MRNVRKTAYSKECEVQKGHKLQQKLTEIDGIRTWSYVHKNKVIHKNSAQYLKACRKKVRKTVTDGRTDGRTETRTDGRTDITIP